MAVKILIGDVREQLKTLADESVHCVVTSPPYWGLRCYGVDGQMGSEPTYQEHVDAMVVVFREVKRVLRKDGTLWLNYGDSYAAGGRGGGADGSKQQTNVGALLGPKKAPVDLKPKDLCGIPWRVAMALQEPYYAGHIKAERDRVWMAAILDGEGTICGFRHERPDGNVRTGSLVFITNGSEAILNECDRIWPGARYIDTIKAGDEVLGATATRDCWRWQIQKAEERSQFLREIYPYLIEKKKQCIVGYNLAQFSIDAKKHGRGGDSEETKGKRQVLAQLLSDLNQRRTADLPTWLKEPPSLYEPGYYLRQDIIWSKMNPMPESVRDRCTKAHEYIFLLTKSPRYYFDAEAIAEPAESAGEERGGGKKYSDRSKDIGIGGAHNLDKYGATPSSRNKRSVWEITTSPFPEAHFATFPPELPEICIKAGTSEKGCCWRCGSPWRRVTKTHHEIAGTNYRSAPAKGTAETGQAGNRASNMTRDGFIPNMARVSETIDWEPSCEHREEWVPCTVLDPFGGAGTTGLVADRLQRNAILIELNPQYAEMAKKRIYGDAPMFAEVNT